jgi:hypothetical protein
MRSAAFGRKPVDVWLNKRSGARRYAENTLRRPSGAKGRSQVADKQRAPSRLDLLSEEEVKRFTTREIFAYFKVIDKADRKPFGANLRSLP